MKEYEPDAVFPESNIIEKATFDGIGFSCAKEYGVGMDCHRPFIQVNVLFWNNGTILEKRKEFGTDRALLCEARDWAEGILRTCASPPADVSEGIHYVIESTGACHACVLGSWQAEPPGKEAGERQGSGNRLRRQWHALWPMATAGSTLSLVTRQTDALGPWKRQNFQCTQSRA